MKSYEALTALVLFAAMRSGTFADTVSLSPQKDNALYEDPAGQISNGQGIYFFAGTSTIARNDDWQTTQIFGIITSDQVAQIQNSQLAPTNPAESAIIATLQPGSYTAIVRGVNNTTGNGLVEVYALQ